MKKISFFIFVLVFAAILKANFSFAADPKVNQADLKAIAAEAGLSDSDIKNMMQGDIKSRALPEEKGAYDFSSLSSWALTMVSVLGLGIFFYAIRKKL